MVCGRDTQGEICEGHQDAAMDQAIDVAVFGLSNKGVFIAAITEFSQMNGQFSDG